MARHRLYLTTASLLSVAALVLTATVIGSVWATRRLAGLPNGAFLEVEAEGSGQRLIAFDVLGSGVGERVLIAQGSVAAAWFPGKPPPVDALIIGSIVIIAMMWVLLTFHPIEGAATRWHQNLFAAVFVVVFGFLFVTVAGRISGLLGNSSNPISGMSIATLMATCAIFFVAGWTSSNYAVLALMIGGVVCIAAAIAGATSQDLKTGFLVGATPAKQQIALVIGVLI